jgi:hypothetical protein
MMMRMMAKKDHCDGAAVEALLSEKECFRKLYRWLRQVSLLFTSSDSETLQYNPIGYCYSLPGDKL